METTKIVESLQLHSEIDFVLKQLSKEKNCKPVEQIRIAKKYNLNYGSKLAMLMAYLIEIDKK